MQKCIFTRGCGRNTHTAISLSLSLSLSVSVSLCLVGLSPSSRFCRGQLLTKVCFLVLWGGTGQEGVQWEEGQWRRRRGVVGGGDGGVVVLELSAISGQLIDFRHSVTDVPPL